MERAAHLIISGRVQGVFYRAKAASKARRLGLSGFVRNLSNGNVEVLLQGDELAVNQMVAWCRKGPPAAQVDSVEVAWVAADPKFKEFDIR